ncbi:hypothetical protein KC980_03700 [candidate division WWE3 bacterium]|uniref:Uncharacterized protein n=1 Tax=candidate division WWE3 bacterium TaxID=2053526 RepID=A0A955EDL3_UNCKA|nr:hypothetical protein [candidate division WWE3 bacterium]
MFEELKKYINVRTFGIIADAWREIQSPSGQDLASVLERLEAVEKELEAVKKKQGGSGGNRGNN